MTPAEAYERLDEVDTFFDKELERLHQKLTNNGAWSFKSITRDELIALQRDMLAVQSNVQQVMDLLDCMENEDG